MSSSQIIRSPRLADRVRCGLLVIDLQEKLLPAIRDRECVLHNIDRLCRGAELMNVPSWASVQYPKGLGPLDSRLSEQFPDPFEKLDFSAAAVPDLVDALAARELSQVVVVGIESHVCVLQTALDLLARHYDIFVVADAIAARGQQDHQLAIQRMLAEGATITTTESILFEWCQTAADHEFKKISAIIREG